MGTLRRINTPALIVFVAVALAAALYAPSLSLPLLPGDAGIAQWVSAGASGPLVLHIICVVAHTVNTLLAFRVARIFMGNSPGSAIIASTTALLFACHPLSVQAVAWPSGLSHLIALILLQVAVLACATLRRNSSPPWGGAEGGGGYLNLALAFALYLIAYWLIFRSELPASVLSLDGVIQRALVAAQVLAHPLVWLLSPLELSGVAAVIVSLAAMSIGLTYAGSVARPAIVGGLVWFVLAVVLPVFMLPTAYVESAPRVFYIASLGASLVWAGIALSIGHALAARIPKLPESSARIAAAVVVAIAGSRYVLDTQGSYSRASEPIQTIAHIGEGVQLGESMLALNAPSWVAPKLRRFPLFIERLDIFNSDTSGRAMLLANTGLDRDVLAMRFASPYQSDFSYTFESWGEDVSPGPSPQALTRAARVLATEYRVDGPHTRWLGGTAHTQSGAIEATFDGRLALVQHATLPCRDGWTVVLHWRNLGAARATNATDAPSATLSAFVQALHPGGSLITQVDGPPLAGLLRFVDLPGAIDIVDRRVLTLTAPANVVTSTLHVGIYDFASGERLVATNPAGQRLANDAFTLALPQLESGKQGLCG